jgi:hypothetical protein
MATTIATKAIANNRAEVIWKSRKDLDVQKCDLRLTVEASTFLSNWEATATPTQSRPRLFLEHSHDDMDEE